MSSLLEFILYFFSNIIDKGKHIINDAVFDKVPLVSDFAKNLYNYFILFQTIFSLSFHFLLTRVILYTSLG